MAGKSVMERDWQLSEPNRDIIGQPHGEIRLRTLLGRLKSEQPQEEQVPVSQEQSCGDEFA